MRVFSGRSAGQIVPVFSLGLIVFLAMIALGADVSVMYVNWARLQKAVDAGALAGANYLPYDPNTAKSTALAYAQSNGLKAEEVAAPTVSADDLQISVGATRTVPYFFARLLGLFNQDIKVSATAAVPYSVSCVGCAYTQSPNTFTPSYGANTGDYPLIPIAIDSTTPYNYNQPMTLHYQQLGPGNWGTVELGAPGGAVTRENIADGYTGPLQVGDYINTEPGKKVGPVDQGFQDRLNAAAQSDPAGTFSLHTYGNPRVVYVPTVDWSTVGNGRNALEVQGFAALWVDSVNGSTLNVHFISQVAPKSLPNTSAPYAGVRGAPILIK